MSIMLIPDKTAPIVKMAIQSQEALAPKAVFLSLSPIIAPSSPSSSLCRFRNDEGQVVLIKVMPISSLALRSLISSPSVYIYHTPTFPALTLSTLASWQSRRGGWQNPEARHVPRPLGGVTGELPVRLR